MHKTVYAIAAAAIVAACLVTFTSLSPEVEARLPGAKSDRADVRPPARECLNNLSKPLVQQVRASMTGMMGSTEEKRNYETRHSHSFGRIPLLGKAGVHTLAVTINGVAGNFILDTGAEYVSVTSEFAAIARINIEAGKQLLLKNVGGTSRADVGYAISITVDRAEAQDVVVAVLRGDPDPFPNHMDGLLGMSFLARFKMELSQDGLVLTPIRSADSLHR